MPATQITVSTLSRTGVNLTTLPVAANALGNYWTGTGSEYFYAVNGSGAPITASFVIQSTVDGVTPSPKTVSIPASTSMIVGPFPTQYYNDATATPSVNVTYSGVTSLTVAVLKSGT